MANFYVPDREALQTALDSLQPGDCLMTDSFACVAGTSKELAALVDRLSELHADFKSGEEGVDTTGAKGDFFLRVCRAMAALDRAEQQERCRQGIQRAKKGGKYKGRKPIAVDETLFDRVVERWQNGEITARQAMRELQLKPNTFYRRIKEREEQKMKDYKEMEKTIRSELRESTRQSKKAMGELKKQVKSEAREIKKAAAERLDAHDVEKEIRREKLRAEIEHSGEMRQMKKDVESEAAELKKILSESAAE